MSSMHQLRPNSIILNCSKEASDFIFNLADKQGVPVYDGDRRHENLINYPHLFISGLDEEISRVSASSLYVDTHKVYNSVVEYLLDFDNDFVNDIDLKKIDELLLSFDEI